MEQKKIWVIMPKFCFNILAWSTQCWLTEEDAQAEIDRIADGDDEYRNKWSVRPLNINKGTTMSTENDDNKLYSQLRSKVMDEYYADMDLAENAEEYWIQYCEKNKIPW